MDINNSEEVKKFVKRTVKEHPEIEFTSDNFIEKSRELQLSPEFNDALSSATDALSSSRFQRLSQVMGFIIE